MVLSWPRAKGGKKRKINWKWVELRRTLENRKWVELKKGIEWQGGRTTT